MALIDNIEGYWKFDESSGNANDEVSTNDLTNVGTATFSSGKINNGADLNGSSQRFNITSSVLNPGTGDFSWSGWFKMNASEADAAVLCHSDGSGVRDFLYVLIGSGGTIGAELAWSTGGNTGISTPATATDYADGAWHHFVLRAWNDSVAHIDLTIDDNEVVSANHASRTYSIIDFSGGLFVGAIYNWSTGGISSYATGSVDEYGRWGRKITDAEITSLYNAGAGLAYPFVTSEIKTIGGLAVANVKTVNGLAIASVKTINDLA